MWKTFSLPVKKRFFRHSSREVKSFRHGEEKWPLPRKTTRRIAKCSLWTYRVPRIPKLLIPIIQQLLVMKMRSLSQKVPIQMSQVWTWYILIFITDPDLPRAAQMSRGPSSNPVKAQEILSKQHFCSKIAGPKQQPWAQCWPLMALPGKDFWPNICTKMVRNFWKLIFYCMQNLQLQCFQCQIFMVGIYFYLIWLFMGCKKAHMGHIKAFLFWEYCHMW